MAGKLIKGLTVEIGGDTTKLGKALSDVETKSRSLSSELGQINRLLKLDPTNTELLAQKQKVLAEAISNTEAKLDTLREAEKQVQAQFEKGEVSEAQYRDLQREIIATEAKLKQYKTAAQETADAVDNLGDESGQTATELDKVEKEAGEADQATSDLGAAIGTAVKGGFTALIAAATAVATAIVGLAEATREYRTEMGKLDSAFSASGYSSDTAKAAYKELQGVIGETDQAVEAAQQIALLAESEEDVAKWAELAAGVVGTFGDALQPETFYEAANETLKLGEATGAYVQMLEGVGMDVDDFNEGLKKCNTAAERQEYLLGVTEKALGDAGKEYKKNNQHIIDANNATDDWNEALADLGGYMEPVLTDFKKLGTSLLKNAKEPLKAVADFVRTKFIPALTNAGNWVIENLPKIGIVAAGLTATIVLYKAAVLSAELATKGLTIATIAQQAAQAALNVIMNANPVILVATAVVGLTTALIALSLATEEAGPKVSTLTEEERKLQESAAEAAQAFRDQKAATDEALADVTAEMTHTQNLATELQNLADASGRVKEKDQERANFIINELNEALGTEYEMVGGVIQQYGDLKNNIDQVIQSKLANSLLEAANEQYVAAIQNEGTAWEALGIAEKDYMAQKQIHAEETQRIQGELITAQENLKKALAEGSEYEARLAGSRVWALKGELNEVNSVLDEKEAAYNDAAANYKQYSDIIISYEDAQGAALEGNYNKAVDILSKKGGEHSKYTGTVNEETAKQLAALEKAAVDAGIAAAKEKENFEKGLDGFTKTSVMEAEQGYKKAMDAYANAYADAHLIGGDLGDGLSDGMENKRSSLYSKASSLVSGIISRMKKAADSNSPSKKTMAFGEDLGEGTEIGIDKSTKDVERAATRQAASVLDAYSSQEVAGQKALRRVADQQAVSLATSQLAAANANSPLLERILTAIEKGQILVLDGDAVVGGTAHKMDRKLGQIRLEAARGAR